MSATDQLDRMSEIVVKYQVTCAVCGEGLIVRSGGNLVPERERLLLTSVEDGGSRIQIPVHATCLERPDAGRAILKALGVAS